MPSLHLLKTQLLDRRARSERSQTLAGGIQKSKSSILSPAMARTSAGGGGIKKSRSTVMNESSPSPRLSSKDLSERQFVKHFLTVWRGRGRFSLCYKAQFSV